MRRLVWQNRFVFQLIFYFNYFRHFPSVLLLAILALWKLASRTNHRSTCSEEKLLNDSGAGHPLNNFSKPSQTTDVESSMLVMSSISVGPSWWQIMLGWWKNFFGGEIKSFDKMLGLWP